MNVLHLFVAEVIVVDLYSASRSASNALIVPLRRKRWVFSADLKPSVLRSGSWSECGSQFWMVSPAMLYLPEGSGTFDPCLKCLTHLLIFINRSRESTLIRLSTLLDANSSNVGLTVYSITCQRYSSFGPCQNPNSDPLAPLRKFDKYSPAPTHVTAAPSIPYHSTPQFCASSPRHNVLPTEAPKTHAIC